MRTEIAFSVFDAAPSPRALAPEIGFALAIESKLAVQSIALRVQIRADVNARSWSNEEVEALVPLFGARPWRATGGGVSFAQLSTVVTGFADRTTTELAVPVSVELSNATTRLFEATRAGSLPLRFLFAGSVFFRDESGMRVVPIDAEASYALPVAVWHALVAAHHPHGLPTPLRRETAHALERFRVSRALPDADAAVARLLEMMEAR